MYEPLRNTSMESGSKGSGICYHFLMFDKFFIRGFRKQHKSDISVIFVQN